MTPTTAAEWADLLMGWYEGHTVPSQALRDEIERVLSDYAHQQVEAFREQVVRECEMVEPEKPTRYFYRREELPAAIRALGVELTGKEK